MAVLSGRYELGPAVGNGGMGDVYEAYDQKLSRPVAVKLLRSGISGTSARERFGREVRHAAAFAHPNVVTVFDVGEDGGRPYFVMELVQGRTLAARLADDGPLPVDDAVRIADAVLAGLAAAHARGLVHRDVKPGNVLLGTAGDVKLADFGIAKVVHDASPGLTTAGQILGTPAYLSPEQTTGDPTAPPTDVYAVGIVLYEMLAGAPPFKCDTPIATALAHRDSSVPPLAARRPDAPAPLVRVVDRALEKEPHDRFADAQEMRAALASATQVGSTTARTTMPVAATTAVLPGVQQAPPAPPPVPPRVKTAPARPGPRPSRRPRRLVPVLAVLGALALIAGGVAVALGGGGGADLPASADRAGATGALTAADHAAASTTTTTVPTPRSLPELVAVLSGSPGAYGPRTSELLGRLGTIVTGRDRDGKQARALAAAIPGWAASGQLDQEIGGLTIQLLTPYLAGSGNAEGDGGGDDEQGPGKGDEKAKGHRD